MRRALRETDWTWLEAISSDEGAETVTTYVLELARCFIPHETKEVTRNSHPWVNERCKQLVDAKHKAEGTERFVEVSLECSNGLLEEYFKYVEQVKLKLKFAKPNSKQYWKLCRQLIHAPT